MRPFKILIVGGSSYIGRVFCSLSRKKYDVAYTYLTNPVKIDGCQGYRLDIRNRFEMDQLLRTVNPDVIYHLAYNMAKPWESIVEGTWNLIQAKEKVEAEVRKKNIKQRIKFFFLSTDAVFDGGRCWYKECDIPHPIWEYGKAKYKAEQLVISAQGFVIRTSLVYGFNPMDPRTEYLIQALKDLREGHAYFEDEYRCPIYVEDLCEALLQLVELMDLPPILHVAGPERLSRYELARRLADGLGLDGKKVKKGLQKDIPAIRPKDVSLDTSLARKILKTRPMRLEEILNACLSKGTSKFDQKNK